MPKIEDDPRLTGTFQRVRKLNNIIVPSHISDNVAESIIDSCRNGVAPEAGALFIATGQEQLFHDLSKDLKSVTYGSSSLRIINGELGIGKSFILRIIEEFAIEYNFTTSFVTLSNRECPMYDLAQLYRFIVRNIGIGSQNNTIEDILDNWAKHMIEKYEETIMIFDLVPREIKELDNDFIQALTVYFKSTKLVKINEKYLALRWIRGETNLSDAKRLQVKKNLDRNNALLMLGQLAKMMKFIGKSGFVVLIDEMDTISQIEDRDLLEMAFSNTYLLNKAYTNTPFSYFAFATTPVFLNSEKNRYSKNYNDHTDIQLLEDTDLFELGCKIRDLHFRVYDWSTNKINSKLLRKFIRNCRLRSIKTPRDFLRLIINRLDYCRETPLADIENTFINI